VCFRLGAVPGQPKWEIPVNTFEMLEDLKVKFMLRTK